MQVMQTQNENLKIVLYPDQVLTNPTQPVLDFGIAKQFVPAMRKFVGNPGVLGLAANQIGLPYSICVVRLSELGIKELINPVVQLFEGKNLDYEGCLSMPGVKSMVARSASVRVEFFDMDCNKMILNLSNMDARVVQHEVDHLNGVMMIDRISTYHRGEALKKWKLEKRRLQK